MATLIIDYGILSAISKSADSVSKKAGKYADNLTEKVLNKFDDIEGGSSNVISDAKYYVKAKINSLRDKEEKFAGLAQQIRDFSDKAKRVDEAVEKAIARNQESFLSKHEHLRIDEWKANLLNWLVDLKNKCPIFELIGDAIRAIDLGLGTLADNIRYWYECEGGREALAIVAAIAGLVIAVVLLVVAWPAIAAASTAAAMFVAVCGVIGAVITVVNAVTNLITSIRAYGAARNNDPAWARIYGNQDKLSDVLRQTNFDNEFLNRLTNITAVAIDTVELFCDIVGLVDAIRELPQIFGKFQKIRWREVLDWDFMGKPCGTKWVMEVDKNGRVLYDITWTKGQKYLFKREGLKIAYDAIKSINDWLDRDFKGSSKNIITGILRPLPILSQLNDLYKILDDIEEMLSRHRQYKMFKPS